MGLFSTLQRFLSFDERAQEFELTEVEAGEPNILDQWTDVSQTSEQADESLSSSLDETTERLKLDFKTDINPDLNMRKFMLGGKKRAMAVFISGMVNSTYVSDFILREGMRAGCIDGVEENFAEYMIQNVFAMHELALKEKWNEVKKSILDGQTVVFIDGEAKAIVMDTRGYPMRGVETSKNEKVIRGPQEAFNENLRTNVTLIRRIIRTDDLVSEFREVGAGNNKKIAIMYREGVANISLVEEVKRRLAKIDTQQVIGEGTIEQLTERHRFSPLPQILSTERPDSVSYFLMQGHIAVLVDGNPYANVMPVTLFSLMSSPEDIYLKHQLANVLRATRYIGAIMSVMLPGMFLAMCLYHQGLLSTEVLSTIVASRKMVFAPLGGELLMLLLVFQLVREAGVRVPGASGQAIGIIGGLILGQAAVSANVTSPISLIVVGLAGLGNYCSPNYGLQLSMSAMRMYIFFAAWIGGLMGITVSVLILVCRMSVMKSYGVPFISPISPKTKSKGSPIWRGNIKMHKRSGDAMNTMEDRSV